MSFCKIIKGNYIAFQDEESYLNARLEYLHYVRCSLNDKESKNNLYYNFDNIENFYDFLKNDRYNHEKCCIEDINSVDDTHVETTNTNDINYAYYTYDISDSTSNINDGDTYSWKMLPISSGYFLEEAQTTIGSSAASRNLDHVLSTTYSLINCYQNDNNKNETERKKKKEFDDPINSRFDILDWND